MSFINAFFCSISNFFFSNIFTFLLFIAISVLLYIVFIRKLNNYAKNLFVIFFLMIFAGGIVMVLLPNSEDMMDPILVNSFYFSPFELFLLLALLVSILLSRLASAQTRKKALKAEIPVKKTKQDNKEKLVETNTTKENKKIDKEIIITESIEKKKTVAKKSTKKSPSTKTKNTKKVVNNKKTNTK